VYISNMHLYCLNNDKEYKANNKRLSKLKAWPRAMIRFIKTLDARVWTFFLKEIL